MKKTKTKEEAAPAIPQVTTENKEPKSAKYVVVRDGYRVSDKEYFAADDPAAIHEQLFWTRVARMSFSEPVDIVQYDSKKHRVW